MSQREIVEREGELARIADAVEAVRAGGDGVGLLIEGPAGVGKTSLLAELEARAQAGGMRVLRARGTELERDFGFGVVRQLFGPALRSRGEEQRERLFSGPAGLARSVFGFGEEVAIESRPAESTLYGLFWLVANLASEGPMTLVVDDAHWSDTGSLRFLRYLAQRLEALPVLVALGARPNEPGGQAEMVAKLAADLGLARLAPDLLSPAGTAAIVQTRLGERSGAGVEAACHEASGGNPFLLEELLVELEAAAPDAEAIAPERVAAMGPERIAASISERAERLHRLGPEAARAVAVLGAAANLGAVAALVGTDPATAAGIVDGLSAASILVDAPGHRFVHPLLRAAVYEDIPAASRAVWHARAARLLADRGASAEEVAAHLLLAEPGAAEGALPVLEQAATAAIERGTPDAAVTYLRRALEEVGEGERRAHVLDLLGHAELAVRDPASIPHLQEAAALITDPARALAITAALIEVLAYSGEWEAAGALIESADQRFGGGDLPGTLDIEGYRTSMRGYDPTLAVDLGPDLEAHVELLRGREDEESALLRWIVAGLATSRGLPRETVLELVGAPDRLSSLVRPDGRESGMISNAILALLLVDSFEGCEQIAATLSEDGRRRGSVTSMILGVAVAASLDARRGRLAAAEMNLDTAVELITANELSLMMLTTTIHFCLEAIVERSGLQPLAALVEGLELPPMFEVTTSGAMAREVRGALRLAARDREGAIADLRHAESIFRPLGFGPRYGSWRSRLALALPAEEREEALTLAAEERELAIAAALPRGEGIALRTLGILTGGEAGIELMRESVAVLRDGPAPLELARSLAELGAALRRLGRRSEARETLREALDLAQRCGAERLEQRAQEELRIAGAKPRRRAISGVAALTPSEQRVAKQAAAGASNPEIAQELFLTLRTVEMHLTNTYRKLGISSRSELGAELSAEPAVS